MLVRSFMCPPSSLLLLTTSANTFLPSLQFYEDKKTSKLLPGKKGISLSVEQWKALVDVMPTIVGLVDAAKK